MKSSIRSYLGWGIGSSYSNRSGYGEWTFPTTKTDSRAAGIERQRRASADHQETPCLAQGKH